MMTQSQEVMEARNEAAWAVFESGADDEVTLSQDGPEEIRKYLDAIGRLITSNGERFLFCTVAPTGGVIERAVTLTPQNYQELLDSLDFDNLTTDDTWEGSDGKTQEILQSLIATRGQFKFVRVSSTGTPSASGRAAYRRVSGEFFRYLHCYRGPEDAGFAEILSRYQVFGSVEDAKDAYSVNCIVHALMMAGVSEVTVNDLKHRCRRREVPRIELKAFCQDNDIAIHLCEPKRDPKDGILKVENMRKINAKGRTKVSIAVICGHYIVHEKVPGVHKWALDNYTKISHKPKWWRFRNARNRITDAEAENPKLGMWSFQLLDWIRKTPITLEDAHIFMSLYADSVPTYNNLAYPPSAVKPFERKVVPQEYVGVISFDIETNTRYNNSVESSIADMKQEIIMKHGEAALERVMYSLDADASEEDILYKLQMVCCHKPFLACCKELEDKETLVFQGADVGLQFLEYWTRRYGGKCELETPTISEVPENTFTPQVDALTTASALAPLQPGVDVRYLHVPKNVYHALSNLKLADIVAMKADDPDFQHQDAINEMAKLKNVMEAPHQEVGNVVQVVETYQFSEKDGGIQGRLFPVVKGKIGGTSGLMSALRANVLSGCADLDMSCCAQTVYAYLCTRNNIPCPATREYVEDKRAVRREVAEQEGVSVARAKQLINRVYNWDDLPCIRREHKSPTLLRLAEEAQVMRDRFWEVDEHQWIADSVAGRWNCKGCFMSRLYNVVENKLLLVAARALERYGVPVQCLMFDGFAIPAQYSGDKRIIDIVEMACEAFLPTIDMRWEFKALDFSVRKKATREVIGTFDLRDAPTPERIKQVRAKVPQVCVLAHNGTYDWSCLLTQFNGRINFCERRTDIICGYGIHHTQNEHGETIQLQFSFKDSNKLIPKKLKDFPQMFQLKDVVKEAYPYSWYTVANTSRRYATPAEIKPHVSASDFEHMSQKMHEFGYVQPDGTWDMMSWAIFYCKQDVRVLEEGFAAFRTLVREFANIDPIDFPTLASLADKHLTNQKCYTDVYSVSAIVQDFIAGANIGGRCLLGGNERSISSEQADVDVTSLYPAAMATFPGFLMGTPKVIDTSVHTRSFLNSVDGYFVDFLVESVGRDLTIPVTCVRANQKCNWTNRLENCVIRVDKTTLEDLETYQGVTGRILRGYYYNEGRNVTVKDTIRRMFDLRAEYKDKDSPKYNKSMSEVIKLLMNTSYGVLSMRPIDTTIKYITEAEKKKFVEREYNSIKQMDRVSDRRHRVEQYIAIGSSFNRIHCSAEILSYSKRIMNRALIVAEDLGIRVSYTDTDSIHIPAASLPRLSAEYDRRYASEPWFQPLCGKKLGQMHPDFEWVGCLKRGPDGMLVEVEEQPVGGSGSLVAETCIAVGKKIYMDKLRDADGNYAYHIRLKGVSSLSFRLTCNLLYDGDVEALFLDLYHGKAVDFDLTLGGGACFKTLRSHQVASVRIVRRIQVGVEAEDMLLA